MDVVFEPDGEDDQNFSPAEEMFEAVKNNDIRWLRKILKKSDDPEELTSKVHQESGSTALMFASRVLDR